MDRRLPIVAVVLALGAGLAWRLGYLGPKAGGVEEGPVADGDAPSLAGAPGDATTSGVGATALARGGTKPVAKTKPPTVDGPRVTGHVIDRDGKPVPDAHVISIPDSTTTYFSAADLGNPTCPAYDAVTDEKGAFVVAVSKDAPMHAIVVEAATYGSTMEGSVRAGADITIVLDKAASIHGTVMTAEGTPLVGARVRVIGSLDAYRVELEALAGVGGTYRIEGVPATVVKRKTGASPYATTLVSVVEVTADSFAPILTTGVDGLEPGQAKLRDFVLVHGAVVSGTVVDAETATPIEGARVVLWSTEGDNQSLQRPGGGWLRNLASARALGETVSAKDGTFRFDHVPAQGFHAVLSLLSGRRGPVLGQVAAWKAGYGASGDAVSVMKDGGLQETTLKLWPAAVVEGRVVLPDGKPPPKAAVYTDRKEGVVWLPTTLYSDAPSSYAAELGADGRYRITGVSVPSSGTTVVKLTAHVVRQGPFQEWSDGGDGSVTVQVQAGATVVAPDLVLRAADLASATPVEVVNPDGQPVWGATIGPMEVWGGGGLASTDAAGRVTIRTPTGPNRPPTVALAARAKGWAPTPFTLTAGSTELVRVTLLPAHRLTGRVLLSDRTPAASATLRLADGNQPIDQVFPPPSADGASFAKIRRISPGGAGRPVGPIAFTLSDNEGRFLFEDLAEGPYHLLAIRGTKGISSASRSPAQATIANVATDTTDLEIVLPGDDVQRTGGVEGTVVDGTTGRPVSGLSVTLRRGEEIGGYAAEPRASSMGYQSGAAGTISSPGRYEIPSAVAGSWSLTAVAEGFRPRTVEGISIRPSETTTVPPIALDHGTTVRGRATVPAGVTTADRVITFQDQGAEAGRERWLTAEVAVDGAFTLAGFTPGMWKVSSYKPGASTKQEPPLLPMGDQRLEIHDGDTEVRFDVNLVAGGSLLIQPTDDRLPPARWEGGTATDAQKKFGEACKLTVLDASGAVVAEQRGVRRNDVGKLTGLLLLPGHYVVRFELPGGETREEAVDVTSGGQVQVQLGKK